jgi:hypothetical protein
MSLAKMTLTAFEDGQFKTEAGGIKNGPKYVVMMNPESIKHGRTIEYSTEQVPDSSKSADKYKHSPGGTLSFDLVLDCTGVVDSKRVDMETEITHLEAVIYQYNGKIHRPNFVQICWRKDRLFQGVLTSFETTYTLFKPNGAPLRAKLSLAFKAYTDTCVRIKKEQKNSPDMTHLVDVVAGDTLGQLSQRIYNSADYTVALAQFNGLDKFRQLPTARQLIFPPLVCGDN